MTDPDSRLLHARKGRVQGYNAQAVTTLEQLIVAAELALLVGGCDLRQPHPPWSAGSLATGDQSAQAHAR